MLVDKFIDKLGNIPDSAKDAFRTFLTEADETKVTINDAKNVVDKYNSSIEVIGVKAKAASVGTKLLKTSLNALTSIAVTMVISLIIKTLDNAIHRYDNLKTAAQTLSDEQNQLKSELENVNAELINTGDRIDELQAKDSLSLLEENELNNLRDANIELENQKANLEALEKMKMKETHAATLKAFNTISIDEVIAQDSTAALFDNQAEIANVLIEKHTQLQGKNTPSDSKEIEKLEKQIASIMSDLSEFKNNSTYGYNSDIDAMLDSIDIVERAFRKSQGTETNRDILLDKFGGTKNGSDYINDLSAEDIDIIAESADFAKAKLEDLPSLLEDVKSKAEELGDTSTNTAQDIIGALSLASSGIQALNNAQTDFQESGAISFSTLKDIKEQFAKVEDIDAYIDKLSDTSLSSEALSGTLSELTGKYIAATIGVNTLADADERLLAKMLEENGIANSVAVAQELIANAKNNTTAAVNENIDAYIAEMTQMSYSEESARYLAEAYASYQNTMSAILNDEVNARLTNLGIEIEGVKTVADAYEILAQHRADEINKSKAVWSVMDNDPARQMFGDRVRNLETLSDDEQTFINAAKEAEATTKRLDSLKSSLASKKTPTVSEYKGNPSIAEKSAAETEDVAKETEKAEEALQKQREEEEKLRETSKSLADEQEKLADAQEKLNEALSDIDKEQSLSDFKHKIELVNQELENFGTNLSLLDTKLDSTFQGDYVSKIQSYGTQFKIASEYSADLRTELEKLMYVTPANADEAEVLADELESLGDKYYENQRAIIEYRDSAMQARADLLGEIADMSSKQSDSLSSMVDKSLSIMENGSITGGFFSTPLLPSITLDAVQKQRSENDRLIAEEKRYREEIAKVRENAAALRKQEDDEEFELKRREAYEEFNKTANDINESISQLYKNIAEISVTSTDAVISEANRMVSGLKSAVDGVSSYASSHGVDIGVKSYAAPVENVETKAKGGNAIGTNIVNEAGKEGYVGKDGKLHWFKDGVQMFRSDDVVKIISAPNMEKILKHSGKKYFNEPIGDLESVTAFEDGNANVSFRGISTVQTTINKNSKHNTPGTFIDEILNEVQEGFDNINISMDGVKKKVKDDLNDRVWIDDITSQFGNNFSSYESSPQNGLTTIALQESSWENLPNEIQIKLSEALQASADTWSQWIQQPENALVDMQLCMNHDVSSWDLLSPSVVEILNNMGITAKDTWDIFVQNNPLQALLLLVASWEALKAQIQQYMTDMITIATNGANAIRAIVIDAPSISQESWDALQTVIANKIQEVLTAINTSFKENKVDMNFDIITSLNESSRLSGTAATNPQGAGSSSALVNTAKQYLGVPYVWGGTTPAGFDCSGLMQYVYAQNGIPISRTTYTQINEGQPVSRENLRDGDLVFFGSADSPHHVGMYIGNGQYLHAPATGDVVKISDLDSRRDFAGGRRIINSYYTGTGGAKAGLATLGDGNAVKGDFTTPAPELVFKKSGGAYLAGINGTEVVNLDAGDTVVPHEETVKILKQKNSCVTGNCKFNSYAKGTFPTYPLTDSQAEALAVVVKGEAGDSKEGCYAEASQMANLNEVGYGNAPTPNNLLNKTVIKHSQGGFYADSSWTRGSSDLARQAVRDVIINGYRTLPRYVWEHDMFPNDIINPLARNQYVQHQTPVRNIYGSSGFFYGFPYPNGDIFFYTRKSDREKYGDFHYDVNQAASYDSALSKAYDDLLKKIENLLGTTSTNTDTGGMKLKEYQPLHGRQSKYDFETPFTSLNKKADGGIIDQDGTVITNELGEESVEHTDGTIESLGTSPRLYKLRKGDKVYNAADTKYLKKYLGNFNRSKITKLANGSLGDKDIVSGLPKLTKAQIEALSSKFQNLPSSDDIFNESVRFFL